MIFSGTRTSGVSSDYENYQTIFDLALSENYTNFFLLTGTELGAFVLPNIAHLFFALNEDTICFTFVIFAFIGVITKLLVIRKSEYFFLAFMLYVSNLYWGQEMITIRAGVASGIFLLSIQDLVNKNNLRYFIKIVIALFFHTSSVLFIVCWLIVRVKVTLKGLLIGLFISFIIAILKINILSLFLLDRVFPKVQIYLESQDLSNGDQVNVFNFMTIFAMIITCFFLYSIEKYKDIEQFIILFKIHILSLILFFALSPVNMVFSLRSFELLSVIQLLLYPMIVKVFSQKTKIIGFSVIIIFSFIQFYYFIFYSKLFNDYSSWLF